MSTTNMPSFKDSDAILRHLEASPQDEQARAALHDALMDEQRDEVMTAGVHWLIVNDVWLYESARPASPDQRFWIAVPLDLGISRRPFSKPTFGATVGDVLRAFSAYLWGLRVWLGELFGDQPVRATRRADGASLRPTVPLPPADDEDDGNPAVVPWQPTVPTLPWRTTYPDWTYRRPPPERWLATTSGDNTKPGNGGMYYYDNTAGTAVWMARERGDG